MSRPSNYRVLINDGQLNAMRLRLADFGRLGINKDICAYNLPIGFLSDGANFVNRDGRLRTAPGYEEVYTGAPVAPYFAMSAEEFWIYAGQDKIYAIDNIGVHNNITRQTAAVDVDYTGSETDIWTGTIFNGIPIFNNGVDAPQIWALPLSTATKMVSMDYDAGNTWDGLGYLASAIRSYKNYLIAMDITKASRDPYMVKWSNAALPGALPTDWDETDDTIDAGEYPITDGDDFVIDGLELGRNFVVYKERSCWLMRNVGGGSVMSFERLFKHRGLLTRRCVCTLPGNRHFVVSDNDFYIHDGNIDESVGDARVRRWFNEQLDSANFRKVQCVSFPAERQVWVIFPESGSSQCGKALIWNWRENVWSPPRDIPDLEALAVGLTDQELTYDGVGTLTYEDATFPYDQSGTQGKSAIMMMVSATNTAFYQSNSGEQDAGSSIRKYVERQSLTLAGQQLLDGASVDLDMVCTVMRLFPRITVEPSNTDISFYIGFQMKIEDAVTWSDEHVFNPSTDDEIGFADFITSGRLLSIRAEVTDDVTLFVDGIEIEFEVSGSR